MASDRQRQRAGQMAKWIRGTVLSVLTFLYTGVYLRPLICILPGEWGRHPGAVAIGLTICIVGMTWTLQAKARPYRLTGIWHTAAFMLAAVTLLVRTAIGDPYTPMLWLPVIGGPAVYLLLARQADQDRRQTGGGAIGWLLGKRRHKPLWADLLRFGILFAVMTTAVSPDSTLFARATLERIIADRQPVAPKRLDDIAATAGQDTSVAALRAYILARDGEMGERLFTGSAPKTVSGLLDIGTDGKGIIIDSGFIGRMLGTQAGETDDPLRTLAMAAHRRQASPMTKDYYLAALLIDRRPDQFVSELLRLYPNKKIYPRHYREALVVYNHIRTNPIFRYTDAVVEADYEDFQDMEKKYTDPRERASAIRETFGNTYWAYYFYPTP